MTKILIDISTYFCFQHLIVVLLFLFSPKDRQRTQGTAWSINLPQGSQGDKSYEFFFRFCIFLYLPF